MFRHNVLSNMQTVLPAMVFAGSICVLSAGAQDPAAAGRAPAARASTTTPQNRLPARASMYYGALWGVDSFSVKWVESGQIIRFSYRVLNATKAEKLNDKKAEPFLIDQRAGVRLVVPTMEKIGQLRQTATPEAGKTYWMAFSNKGRLVRRGSRVSVEIGLFKVDGLVVE